MAVKFTVTDFQIGLEDHIRDRLEVMGEVLRDAFFEELSHPYPPASQPGEYPAKRTGWLQDSLMVLLDPEEAMVDVGPSADYADWLADHDRAMTAEALEDHWAAVVGAFFGQEPTDVPF